MTYLVLISKQLQEGGVGEVMGPCDRAAPGTFATLWLLCCHSERFPSTRPGGHGAAGTGSCPILPLILEAFSLSINSIKVNSFF